MKMKNIPVGHIAGQNKIQLKYFCQYRRIRQGQGFFGDERYKISRSSE